VAIQEAAGVLGIDLTKATVAVQGYGNAGYYAALLLHTICGATIVAVSDSQGGIFNPKGIDPNEALKCKQDTCSVVNLSGSTPVSNEELLELNADILIPAALENVINEENAPRIKAKIVAELANGPTTPEADQILHEKGVHVIPDFLCNAGGVTVSYFEMVQNFYMYYWEEEEVLKRLAKKMTTAYHTVLGNLKKYSTHMRQAAYVTAVERVVEAMKLRGWV